jgi:hypothetical protein
MTPCDRHLYESVYLSYQEGANVLSVHAPWFLGAFQMVSSSTEDTRGESEAPQDSGNSSDRSDQPKRRTAARLRDGLHDEWPKPDLQAVLQSLREFPLSYQVPRDWLLYNETERDVPLTRDYDSPRALLSAICQSNTRLTSVDVALDRNSWAWLPARFLPRARLAEHYDPVSAVELLLEAILSDAGDRSAERNLHAVLARVGESKPEAFPRLITAVLAQSYFVTSQCLRTIAPARNYSNRARAAVSAYLKEEAGHHRLIAESLQRIGYESNPGEWLKMVTMETQALMAVLRHAALHNFLAFCACISLFEAGTYGKEDPIAALMRAYGLGHATVGIDAHFRINVEHQHGLVGAELADLLGPCSEHTVIGALRVVELAVAIKAALAQRLGRGY